VRGVQKAKVGDSNFSGWCVLAAESDRRAVSDQALLGIDFESLLQSGVIRSVTHQVLAQAKAAASTRQVTKSTLADPEKQSVPGRVHSVFKKRDVPGEQPLSVIHQQIGTTKRPKAENRGGPSSGVSSRAKSHR